MSLRPRAAIQDPKPFACNPAQGGAVRFGECPPRGPRLRLRFRCLLLDFAETDCPALSLHGAAWCMVASIERRNSCARSGRIERQPLRTRTLERQGGAARLGEIKEE